MSEPTKPGPTKPPKRPRSPKNAVRPRTQHTKPQGMALPRPASDDLERWKHHWEALGQPWRTEPEIDEERQQFLAERRGISPNTATGTYPFKDIRLSRADIEWLLATHEDGRGPVIWSDETQGKREGIDLRGADLTGEYLAHLPLAKLRGGLSKAEREDMNPKQRAAAGVCLANTNLHHVHLEGAQFNWANLMGCNLYMAHLEQANLGFAHVEGANLFGAQLAGANLSYSFFDGSTYVQRVSISSPEDGDIILTGVHWGEVDLTGVHWQQLQLLGDERQARQKRYEDGSKKDKRKLLKGFERAVRANRQLSNRLRAQGLNEDADRFSYRAQILQRVVLRLQGKILKYMGSWLLWLIAGYGYRPLRSMLIYLCMIVGFAAGYFVVTHILPTQTAPLVWYEALVLSISSFHGRGFFQPVQSLGDPVAILASIEAVFGLLIEVSFIATFTQRFFGR